MFMQLSYFLWYFETINRFRTEMIVCVGFQYACRKALADSQPRIRGRFAKNEECEAKRE